MTKKTSVQKSVRNPVIKIDGAVAAFFYRLPEDREDYDLHRRAGDYYSALWELSQYLRGKLKYEELPDAEKKVFEEVKTKFWEIVNEEGGLEG